ncbi:MAG: aldo/keto reductase [Alphaproteobacteria bacterium]
MEYRLLGRTGIRVSELCFGTMSFAGDADEAEAGRMFRACRHAGINFFDCADGYGRGKAETIIGRLMKGCRDELVITTKCFNAMSPDINHGGGNRRHILRAVEASLHRLDTDRIDILFMHRFEPHVPLEETLRALEKLVDDGKVLYLGASNYAAWQIAKALGISAKNQWPRFDVIQPMYSLVKRQVEVEILPLAKSEGLGVITYSPLGGGLLTGKYNTSEKPQTARLVTNKDYARRYSEDWVYKTAEAFGRFARQQSVHPVTLAVAWAGSHPDITCPIIGARDEEQLQPSLDAIGYRLSPELRQQISDLSRTPAPATDRWEELL